MHVAERDSSYLHGCDMKKNLIIGIATYFMVLAYFFGTASGWNWSAFVKLINPLLIINVLIFACLSVLPTLLLPVRLRRPLLFVSVGLVAVGVLLILLHRTQPEISILAGYDVVNFGAGAISIGIAFLGLDIARESDNKMKAIANLQFDEKVVAMENYMDEFSEPSFDAKLLEPEYKKFLWDLRAMAHVARWVDKERRCEAKVRLNTIASHLAGKMDAKRLNEVKSLCSEIWPERAEVRTMDKDSEQKKTKRYLPISTKGSLREFTSLLFRRGWNLVVIIIDLIGVLLIIDSYTIRFIPPGLSVPSWVWFVVVIVSTLVASFLVFHYKNAAYHTLQEKLIEASEIERSLSNLASLREEGVSLRNDGMQLTGDTEQAEWATKADEWNKRVETEVGSLSKAEAGIYRILDWIDFPIEYFLSPQTPYISNQNRLMGQGIYLDDKTFKHITNLRIHSQRLRGLKDFVLRYSQDLLSRRIGNK